MYAGHQSKANGSPYRACNLALVLRPQARVFGVFDATHLGHVLGHEGEVFILVHRVNA